MAEKTKQTPEVRKPYSAPVVEEVKLVPDETVLVSNCKMAGDPACQGITSIGS